MTRAITPAVTPSIVPTPRAMTVLAGLALLAVVLAVMLARVAPAAWLIGPVLGLIVLALVVGDGLLAGRLRGVDLHAPPQAEVGAVATLAVAADIAGRGRSAAVIASLALDPRLAPDGRLDLTLSDDDAGGHRGTVPFTPTRRCTAPVTDIWLRWAGPLGLGARLYHRPCAAEIRVVPNVAAVRSPALQAFLRDSSFGTIARRLRGEGSLFETLADYQPGMDRRRIDWKVSARHAHLLAKEYEVERNNQIVFAFDCGQAMCEPVDGLPRLDRAVSAALTAAWVALKSGDRVALFGFAAQVRLFTPFATDPRDFHTLRAAAAGLDYETREPNFTLALATLAQRLQRRSLIVVFSDFTDPTSAELMVEAIGRLVSRHRLLFVTLRDAELDDIAAAPPADTHALAMAVSADSLLRQRALVTGRLRALGVDVVEAPHGAVGTRLIDAYLAIKRAGGIG